MFVSVSAKERNHFLQQNNNCFIPGYTGHCPTLRFQYGKCYGARTKEIIRDLKDKHILQDVQTGQYRQSDYSKPFLQPIPRSKDQFHDPYLDIKYRSPKYIIGYTGFIPTLNFRYGKSYGRTATESMSDFEERQMKLRELTEELKPYRSASAPNMKPLRNEDQVQQGMKDYQELIKYKEREISPEFPPIAGYTGHIPRMKDVSLSQRYNQVARQGLSLLKDSREMKNEFKKVEDYLKDAYAKAEGKYTYKPMSQL